MEMEKKKKQIEDQWIPLKEGKSKLRHFSQDCHVVKWLFNCSRNTEQQEKDRGLYILDSLFSIFFDLVIPSPFIHPDPLFSFLFPCHVSFYHCSCEIFICEITRRAWLHAEENKRRTLQRSDVANAVSKSDQFDFLIDIIPREESQAAAAASAANSNATTTAAPGGSIPATTMATQPVGGVVGKDGKAVAYEDQYAHYFPQGGMAGFQHVRRRRRRGGDQYEALCLVLFPHDAQMLTHVLLCPNFFFHRFWIHSTTNPCQYRKSNSSITSNTSNSKSRTKHRHRHRHKYNNTHRQSYRNRPKARDGPRRAKSSSTCPFTNNNHVIIISSLWFLFQIVKC